VTERIVTISGEVHDPQVVEAPIGTTYASLIAMAGGATRPDVVLIDGGPMMGKIIENHQQGISKTTSGVIALPPDHFVVEMNKKPLRQMIKQSKSACCQCFRCSDLCPRNLIGHKLYPHMTMRTIDYNQSDPTEHITSAFLCSQCGLCELVACDFMFLSPRKIYAAYRKELEAKGIKNPHIRKGFNVTSQYENVKVSIPTVKKKLGLTHYAEQLPFNGLQSVGHVRIPVNRHAGAPAKPAVHLKQKVKMCDVIAASPSDKMGSVYHASIAGHVTEITDYWIEITA